MKKLIMDIITGIVLSGIAISYGYGLSDWQWWAWMIGGIIYLNIYSESRK